MLPWCLLSPISWAKKALFFNSLFFIQGFKGLSSAQHVQACELVRVKLSSGTLQLQVTPPCSSAHHMHLGLWPGLHLANLPEILVPAARQSQPCRLRFLEASLELPLLASPKGRMPTLNIKWGNNCPHLMNLH